MKRVRLPQLTMTKFEEGKITEEPDEGGIIALYSLMSGKMKSTTDLLAADKVRQKIIKLQGLKNGQIDLILEDAEFDLIKGMIAPDGNYPVELSITTALAPYVRAFQNPTDLDEKGKVVSVEAEKEG